MYKGELTNSISHLVGAALGLAAWLLLVGFSAWTRDPWKVAACTVYGFTLFFLFLSSTLYHSLRGRPKAVFLRFDHIAIFLLIAGTYTPFTLTILRSGSGWLVFGLVWGFALIGTIFKAIMGGRYTRLSTVMYLLAGWTIMLDIGKLYEALPIAGFAWLLGGGLLYTLGVLFFLKDELPFNHEIWHFLVLAAAGCHFVAVFFYVI